MWRVSTVLEISGVSTAPVNYGTLGHERGTAVHAANEALAEGYTPIVEDATHQPYVDGLIEWYKRFEPHVVAVERRIVNRMIGLTGRIDFFALIKVLNVIWPYIIDVKTGQPAPWHGIQTAGYKELAIYDDELWKLFGPPFDEWDLMMRDTRMKRAVLYLPGNGRALWKEQSDPQDGYLFKSALTLLKWRHERGLLAYTDPEQPEGDESRLVQVLPVNAEDVF